MAHSKLGILVLILLLLLSFHPSADADDQPAGFIIACTGDWYGRSGKSKLGTGETVFAKSELRCASNDTKGRISISLLNGELVSKDCKDSPVIVPDTPESNDGTIRKMIAAVGSLFKEEPQRYVSAISRGGNEEDYVLQIQDGKIDLATLMEGRRSDTYTFHFSAVEDENNVELSQAWNNELLVLSSQELQEGLYNLSVFGKFSEADDFECWILLSGPDQFEKQRSAFENAKLLISSWPAHEASNKRSFLRGVLEYLQSETIKSHKNGNGAR